MAFFAGSLHFLPLHWILVHEVCKTEEAMHLPRDGEQQGGEQHSKMLH